MMDVFVTVYGNGRLNITQHENLSAIITDANIFIDMHIQSKIRPHMLAYLISNVERAVHNFKVTTYKYNSAIFTPPKISSWLLAQLRWRINWHRGKHISRPDFRGIQCTCQSSENFIQMAYIEHSSVFRDPKMSYKWCISFQVSDDCYRVQAQIGDTISIHVSDGLEVVEK